MQQKKQIYNYKKTGFTLIELLVVIGIIAILAAILFPVFARAREKARQAACMSNLKQIGLGLMMYVQDFDEAYPMAWTDHDNGVKWYNSLQPYVKSLQLFACPTAGAIKDSSGNLQNSGGYGFNCCGTSAGGTIGNGFGYRAGSGYWNTPTGSAMKLSTVDEASTTFIIGDPASNGVRDNGYLLSGYRESSFIPVLHGGQVGPFTNTTAGAANTPTSNPPLTGGGNYLFADGHVKWVAASVSYCSNMWNVDKSLAPTLSNYCGTLH